MGRFSDTLGDRIRYRRSGKEAARDLHHPRGFTGVVMWCSLCRAEIMRAPARHRLSHADQQAAFDRHMTVCPKKDAPELASTRREIERAQRRIRRRQWWARRRWVLLGLAVLLASAVVLGRLIARH